MKTSLCVTIVINNYNYARYLRDAIDSALQQSYHPLQVIVVDDGSTDDSRAIIEQYGDRITAVFKENGGQASALNAGFARSHGDIVIFLDADDALLPDLADRVVHLYRQHPRLANVVYRLAMIDDNGKSVGRTVPPAHLALPSMSWSGKGFQAIMNSASWAPTSGNAFAATTLRRLMPMPEEPFRVSADFYLCRISALCGPITSLNTIGGYYRVHQTNAYHHDGLQPHKLRNDIQFVQAAHQHLHQTARSLNNDNEPENDDLADPPIIDDEILDEIHLAQRLISRKLYPDAHPVPGDNPFALGRKGIVAALQRPDLPLLQKAVHVAWFATMILAPRGLVHGLATRFFSNNRPTVNRLLTAATRSTLSVTDEYARNR